MDIGDPSEIPATRRRLPSMQELGAFDFHDPAEPAGAPDSRAAPLSPLAPPKPPLAATPTTAAATVQAAPPAPPPSGATATRPPAPPPPSATPAAAAPRPALTPEQLRQALAKADPQTRQKLMRLIAGGRTVQQVGGTAPSDGSKRRSLVMPLDRTEGSAPRPPSRGTAATAPAPLTGDSASGFGAFSPARGAARSPAPPGSAARSAAAAPRSTARPGGQTDQPVMRIDEHTELLDAAPPPANPAARKAELQAQLEQAQAQSEPLGPVGGSRPDPLAHKVLFPAYDPARHGEDLHGASRRRHEGPIEGHYPAPRQPFKPTYHHPDGRPMNAEETQVEEVLQTQRCEETLGVLARDGVNGLLLSPRDLDAAVAHGVISAEAAASLWKTWSALRPVIHVIEDEPPAAPDQSSEPADLVAADADTPSPALGGSAAADEGQAAEVAEPTDPRPPPAPSQIPATDMVDTHAASAPVAPPLAAKRPAVTSTPTPAPWTGSATTQAVPSPAATADAAGSAADVPTLPLPERLPAPMAAPADAIAAVQALPASTPGSRLRAVGRGLFWLFVAYCVLATSGRLAAQGWFHWGHWFAG